MLHCWVSGGAAVSPFGGITFELEFLKPDDTDRRRVTSGFERHAEAAPRIHPFSRRGHTHGRREAVKDKFPSGFVIHTVEVDQ